MPRKDGGWGWAIVVSSFIIGFLCDGIRSSFGFIYLEFLQEFGESKAVTSWVGSIMFGLMNFLGPVVSILVHRFGCRAVTVCGSGVCAVGYIVSIFGTSVYYLYFSLGVLGGIGFGMLVIPFNVMIIRYFNKKRALAMGIAVCGSGVGSFVFSPMSKALIDEFGWRGTLLIEGAMVLNCVPCGLLMRPFTSGRRKNNHAKDVAAVNMSDEYEAKGTLLHSGHVFKDDCEEKSGLTAEETIKDDNLLQIDLHVLNKSPKTKTSVKNGFANSHSSKIDIESSSDKINQDNSGWFHQFKNLFHISLLKNGAFLLMVSSYLCEGLAYSVPFTYLPDMTVSLGYTRANATWMLSAVAIANTVSRIPIGLFADLRWVNKLYMYIGAMVGVGMCIILLALTKAYVAMVCFCAFIGIFIGSYVVLLPLVLADLFGDDLIADTKGLTCFVNGAANFIGVPIAGVLFDISGEYTYSFLSAGLMYIIGGIVLIFIKCCKNTRGSVKTITLTLTAS